MDTMTQTTAKMHLLRKWMSPVSSLGTAVSEAYRQSKESPSTNFGIGASVSSDLVARFYVFPTDIVGRKVQIDQREVTVLATYRNGEEL
jgi:hypothetical protein